MKNSKTNKSDNTGSAFTSHQKAIDNAVNKKIKSDQQTEKINPAVANKENRSNKSDTARKKTGGGKQSNPGM